MVKPETAVESPPRAGPVPSLDMRLVEQVRRGDADASHRFFREHYPGIYRYLLWLTERPEMAEDLAQETFVRAWRHLDSFDGRAPLGAWLHAIAHREFLRALRSRRAQAPLEEIGEVADARTAELTDAVELREVIRKLPMEEGEVVVLYYLQGYPVQEIARIVRATVSTVKYRLSAARTHLRRELGEGDLAYLNEQPVALRQWAWLPLDRIYALEARLPMRAAEDREMPERGASEEGEMQRREFLRHAAVGAAGLMLPDSDREVVDSRLTQKVTLAFKGTALSDVCDRLRADTGIDVKAGPSIADEKVTLFCKEMPLRDVMRQLSRPFGYTWLRSGGPPSPPMLGAAPSSSPNAGGGKGGYRYELVQDLRSQLMEEELRTRDRHAALLALEREIERYRPYLDLSPDEAMARAAKAPPEEKKLLETLAGKGWGPIQMYFRLSPQEQAALRAGQEIKFKAEPEPGELPLPPDVARGVLQSWRDWRIRREDGRWEYDPAEKNPAGLPPSAVPEVRAGVILKMEQSELGYFTINNSSSGFHMEGRTGTSFISGHNIAVGMSPTAHNPQNAAVNAKLARDAALRPRVRVNPTPSPSPTGRGESSAQAPPSPAGGGVPEPKVTTADVLEALHQATGMPLVADFYTRLYSPKDVAVPDRPLFDALNQVADAMRMRWTKDGAWLQFRTTSFYDDRLKEVPNRLLSRWAASRRQHGTLTLDDLIEIAGLPEEQLDADSMAEGAQYSWGLAEWSLARGGGLRPHFRFLAGLTPAQRQEASSGNGLTFQRLSLQQQQQFIALSGTVSSRARSLEDLAGTVLHVEYTVPGWWLWYPPEALVPGWPPLGAARARGRTREATLQAARRIDPQANETQLRPAKLDAAFIYVRREPDGIHVSRRDPNGSWGRNLTRR